MDSSLHFHDDLAKIKQREWEAAAARQRLAMSVARPSLWARLRPLFARRPVHRPRRPAPSGVRVPRLSQRLSPVTDR